MFQRPDRLVCVCDIRCVSRLPNTPGNGGRARLALIGKVNIVLGVEQSARARGFGAAAWLLRSCGVLNTNSKLLERCVAAMKPMQMQAPCAGTHARTQKLVFVQAFVESVYMSYKHSSMWWWSCRFSGA